MLLISIINCFFVGKSFSVVYPYKTMVHSFVYPFTTWQTFGLFAVFDNPNKPSHAGFHVNVFTFNSWGKFPGSVFLDPVVRLLLAYQKFYTLTKVVALFCCNRLFFKNQFSYLNPMFLNKLLIFSFAIDHCWLYRSREFLLDNLFFRGALQSYITRFQKVTLLFHVKTCPLICSGFS